MNIIKLAGYQEVDAAVADLPQTARVGRLWLLMQHKSELFCEFLYDNTWIERINALKAILNQWGTLNIAERNGEVWITKDTGIGPLDDRALEKL